MLIGEVSNGPFNKSKAAKDHAMDDREKVFKCLKDSMDSLFRSFKSNNNELKVELLSKLNLFGIEAYGGFSLSYYF